MCLAFVSRKTDNTEFSYTAAIRTFSPLCTLRGIFQKNGCSTVLIAASYDSHTTMELHVAFALCSIMPLLSPIFFSELIFRPTWVAFFHQLYLFGGEGRCTNVNGGIFTANINLLWGCQKSLHFLLYSHRALHMYDLFTFYLMPNDPVNNTF